MLCRILFLFLILHYVSTSEISPNHERTFIMIKPDGVQRNLVGKIIQRFENKGFKLVGLKLVYPDYVSLKKHYSDLAKKPFFLALLKYMGSGPVVQMVWEGLNVINTSRYMLGATDPSKAALGTIRGDYSVDISRNIIHGSDGVETAKKEIALWFRDEELVSWRADNEEWIYEGVEYE